MVFRSWRRRRILARESIPDRFWDETVAATPALARLDPIALQRLRDLSLLFLREKYIEPAGGLELADVMRVRIAALACLPILELGLDYYDGIVSVIVYPDAFVVPRRQRIDDAGVVHVADELLTGEAWEAGPVILAWKDVQASGLGRGYNVVVHECAHKLDQLDGATNGIPPLHPGMRTGDWTEAFQSAYDDLQGRLERGETPWLDPYAAEEPAEFFAVCTEMFFDLPWELRAEYPAVYAQLEAFFRQDPGRSMP